MSREAMPGFGPAGRWIVGAGERRLIPAAYGCEPCGLGRDITAPVPPPACPRCGAPQVPLRRT
jgi:hypothetical protein